MQEELAQLLNARIYDRDQIEGDPVNPPRQNGIYAWWIDVPVPGLHSNKAYSRSEGTLLYVGISPKRPPSNGKPPSRQSLRTRIRYHYLGNAYGSTLRLTLGCLLSQQLSIRLQIVGTNRRTFGPIGETTLSEWMRHHARVSWVVHPEPWTVEHIAIRQLYLPLNLDQNGHCDFHMTLTEIRAKARAACVREQLG